MPTNANTFNSRVTSEALEAKFRAVFPSQGGAELGQDLFASGVITPVVDFSSVAEGSVLPKNLQTAWGFSTSHQTITGTVQSLITNTGFWKVQTSSTLAVNTGSTRYTRLYISNGLTDKIIYNFEAAVIASGIPVVSEFSELVVFLRAGDTLYGVTPAADATLSVNYRQIADVNGTLVNPLGFTFS